MNNMQENFLAVVKKASNGNFDAEKFLTFWLSYAHKFDDLVDEEFSLEKLIETNNELKKALTCSFFIDYSTLLLPQIYLAAEAYQASETSQKDTGLGEYLSHEGNNVLRIVALITGGYDLLKEVSEDIRSICYVEHPPKPIFSKDN